MTPQLLAAEYEQTSKVKPLLAADQHDPNIRNASAGGQWMNVVSHLDARFGGLSAVVPHLASMIAATTSFKVSVAAFCAPDEVYSTTDYPKLAITRWPTSRVAWLTDRQLTREFRHQIREMDGVHIHGLWEQSTTATAHAARALGKPYIVSAHGMLDSWALKNKRVKKAIYASLTERVSINGAACLHALTHAEAADYRRFGSRCPIAVIPNGVAVKPDIDAESFLGEFPQLRGKRVVLFLGRIHFKKGLDILVEAWSAIAKSWPEARLVLAGPDFEGTRASIEALVADHGLGESVLFTGMLRDEMKWSALAAAKCFILPSYSEGLSVSTLEAMGAGLPVIITEHCNLPEVTEFETGWVIKAKADEIAASLNEFLRNSPNINLQIGNRGRRLVKERYSWSRIATEMSEVYQWVQGGQLPESVELLRN